MKNLDSQWQRDASLAMAARAYWPLDPFSMTAYVKFLTLSKGRRGVL